MEAGKREYSKRKKRIVSTQKIITITIMAPRNNRKPPKTKQKAGEADNGNVLQLVQVVEKSTNKGKPDEDMVESDLTETSGSVDSKESSSEKAPVAVTPLIVQVDCDWALQEYMEQTNERKEINEKMQVRGAVNKHVWPKLKFIMDPDDELKSDGNIAKAIMRSLQIPEVQVASFWKRNREVVYKAMNSKRNNVVKDIKKAIELDVASGK